MYLPLNYEKINELTMRFRPSSIKSHNTLAFDFWQRALTQRLFSVFEWENLPKEWNETRVAFLNYCLTNIGYVAVCEDERGLWFNPCTLSGYDMYYQPVEAKVTNPAFKRTKSIILNKDGYLLRLTPDYRGVCDIVDYYAEKLAIADGAINTSLVNTKLSYIISGKTKAAIETLKKIVDRVNEGNPAVFFDSRVMDSDPTNEDTNPFRIDKIFSSEDYITDKLLIDHATLLNEFDTEIGIPTLPYQKKERLVSTEADSKKTECKARAKVWIDTINRSLEPINTAYGTNIAVKYAFDKEGVEENETDNTGSVSTFERQQ